MNKPKRVRDLETGTVYSSMAEAGRDLYWLVGGDMNDSYVRYKIVRRYPERFLVEVNGEWISGRKYLRFEHDL